MRRITKYISRPKGSVVTEYQVSSVQARRSGLTVANMVASIEQGDSVSIPTQTFDSDNDQLAYQLSYDEPGKTIVRVTTTFNGSLETTVQDYEVRVLTNEIVFEDYV